MKICVNGSRNFNDYFNFCKELTLILAPIKEDISFIVGGARGADKFAERYAQENNIPYTVMPADWDTYGKQAGFIRNRNMAKETDFLISFWDMKSVGTKDMIRLVRDSGKPVYVIDTNNFS